MAIQTRRGNENDLKIAQLVPGELAAALDTLKLFFCFAAGTAEQIPLDKNVLSIKDNLTNEDLDTILTVGIYVQNSTADATVERHYPINQAGCIVNFGLNNNKIYQMYLTQNSDQAYFRRYISGTWNDWVQFYPTMESGGDGNSNWIKFPDGTMIVNIRGTAQVSETGGFVCTFPQSFVNAQYAVFANALIPYDYVAVAEGNDPGASNIWIYDLTGGSAVGEWVNYTVMAIGRYK